MSGRPPEKPEAVREYIVTQVCDHDAKLKPMVDAIAAGQIEGLPQVSFSYSTARRWVDQEKRLRDAIAPLEDKALDNFDQRLMAVGLAEMRKLERDSHKPQPIDAKRLNELQAFSARMRRQLARDTAQPPVAPDDEAPESMLDRLAREEHDTATREPSSPAASTPQPPTTSRDTATAEQQAAQSEPKAENENASPVHLAA